LGGCEDATQCRQLCILSDKTAICQRKWLELELCYTHLLAIAKVEILTVRTEKILFKPEVRMSTNVCTPKEVQTLQACSFACFEVQ